MDLKIPEYVKALKPYKPGNLFKNIELKSHVKQIINFASNENQLGPSPKVIEAIQKSASKVRIYPDPMSKDLVNVIAEKFDKRPSQVICGHGSESLIAHIVNAFSEMKTRVLTARGTFAGIYVKSNKIGRRLNRVPLKEGGYDLDGILRRIREDTSIIYISNPNNPTGSMVTKDEFDDFIDQVPKNILIVLDEAYSVYGAQHDGYVNGMAYERENMLVLHTLSKTHALAGLRVGYAVGPEPLIDTLYKVKLPFEPSIVAQDAAIAALNDDEFINETIRVNNISLNMMLRTFDRLGVEYIEPAANFVMLHMGDEDLAAEFTKECGSHGIAVRHCKPFGIPDGVRISSGTEEQTEYAISVFNQVYNEISHKYDLKVV